jgi:cytidine deaminase
MADINPETLAKLKTMARIAADHAYAPYSRFPVGAAIYTESGFTFVGCNVENAAYPLGMCAERNAIGQMIAGGQEKIAAIVVYTPTATPTTPCGGCRQVINEFGPNAQVYSFCASDAVLHTSLPELLPNAFGPHNLR